MGGITDILAVTGLTKSKAEKSAQQAQAAQGLALMKQQKVESERLRKEQQRLNAKGGRMSLLSGSELGVQSDQEKKTTLG